MTELREGPPVAARYTRAAGYVLAGASGVSSWEAEVRRMRATAARWGWSLARTWEEEARYRLLGAERPAFAAMVDALPGLAVGVVLVPSAVTLSADPVERCVMVRRIEARGAIVSELPRGHGRRDSPGCAGGAG